MAYLSSLYMKQSWNPLTWWEPTWLEIFWCILTLGKWKITPVYHAMKFGADFGIFLVFSVLWEHLCSCHLTEVWESAQQALSSIIHGQKISKIKIKFFLATISQNLWWQKSDFKKISTIPKMFKVSYKLHGMIYRDNFSLTKA